MDRRAGGLLLVHAHPDDESIGTGATMARYAAEGVPVTLVTCTLGELGEIIPPGLAHLAAEGRLGMHRRGELDAACAALGVSDHRFLGGAGRWRDSGMAGLPDNEAPDCFWQADVGQAAAELATIIREVRPRVLVTYDANGFYGHPDHVQAHRVALRAVTVAADADAAGFAGEPWQVRKVYATAMPHTAAVAAGVPHWVPDDQVTTVVDGTAYLAAKAAAMRAHATQISVNGEFFALSDGVRQQIWMREFYTLLSGPGAPAGRVAVARPGGAAGPGGAPGPGGAAGLDGLEPGLFAGL